MRNSDSLFRRTGELGRWQAALVGLLCLAASVVDNFNGFSMVFLAFEPEHHCNASATAARAGLDPRGFALTETQCSALLTQGDANISLPCTDWVYDRSVYEETLVTEFDLVCDSAIAASVVISILEAATIVGGFIYSFFVDRFGRRPAFLLNIGTYAVGSLISSFMPNLWSFTIVRCFAEMNALSTFNICYIWALEMVGPGKRTAASTSFYVGGAIGKMVMSLVALWSPDWRWMSLSFCLPAFAFFAYAALPESPSWLLSVGRDDEAAVVLSQLSDGRVSPEELKELLAESSEEDDDLEDSSDSDLSDLSGKGDATALDLLREPRLRLKTILLCILFLAVMTVSDTIAFNTQNLSGNFLLIWAVQSSVQAPATLLNVLYLNRFGRIWPLFTSFLLTALFCVLAIPAGLYSQALTAAFSIVANFFIFTAEGIVYQLATEEFPTILRGAGLGVTTVAGDLGVLAMPYIVYTDKVSTELPMLIMASLCIVGAVCTIFLPETLGARLPQSLEDGLRSHQAGLGAAARNLASCCCGEGTAEELEALLVPPRPRFASMDHSGSRSRLYEPIIRPKPMLKRHSLPSLYF